MTNSEFKAWRERMFRSRSACAAAFGLDREAVGSLESGSSRAGNPYSVPPAIALACAAWTIGLRDYDGGGVTIAPAAPAAPA